MAVDASALRSALAQDYGFLNRLQATMAKIAVQVLSESAGTQNHTARVAYANVVMRDIGGYTQRAAFYLIHQTNFINGVIEIVPEGGRFSVRTAVADADAESQVATCWNDLAAIFG